MAREIAKEKENQEPAVQSPLQASSSREDEVSTLLEESHDVQMTSIDGCRIMNVAELSMVVYTLTKHSATCGGACYIEGETSAGLAVVFSVACSKCNACYSLRSSHQITTNDGKKDGLSTWQLFWVRCQLVVDMQG